MIKIVVGLLLVVFDYVISFDGKANFDLLPDFIGYGIILYGFFRIWQRGKEKSEVHIAGKQAMIVTGVVLVLSYVAYLLDMYGVLSGFHAGIIIAVSVILELGLLLVMFMFTQILSALQGKKINFQVKRMEMLWKIMCLCVACEYVSLPLPDVATTFLIFEKVVAVMFMVYVITADRTYKSKYLKK